jgi:hypothetical protein
MCTANAPVTAILVIGLAHRKSTCRYRPALIRDFLNAAETAALIGGGCLRGGGRREEEGQNRGGEDTRSA